MKKYFLFFIIIAFFSSCNRGQQNNAEYNFSIKGRIKNLSNNTLHITIKSSNDTIYDSTTIKKGRFNYSNNLVSFSEISISTDNDSDRKNGIIAKNEIIFFAQPSDHLKIKATKLANTIPYSISGNEFNLTFSETQNQKSKLLENLISKFDNSSVADKNLLQLELQQFDNSQIEKAPFSHYSMHLMLNDNNKRNIVSYYHSLPLQCKEHELGKCLEKKVKQISNLTIGNKAPSILTTTINDTPFKIEMLYGKYSVLYFWGSWCNWSKKGLPKMKDYYAKYNSNVEFVAIACKEHNSSEFLRSTIKTEKLTWTNLVNEDDNKLISLNYWVFEYPTKIILDADGCILGYFPGENNNFYNRLDSLMGNSIAIKRIPTGKLKNKKLYR